MSKHVLTPLALALALGATPAQATTLADAGRMVEQCFAHATSQKYPPLSVAVIDQAGALVAFGRQDGASAASPEAALLKARTALKLNAPTDVLAPAVGGDQPTRDAFLLMNLTMLPGGLPIADGDGRLVGAIGVSGGTAEHDVGCGKRALEARPAPKKK